MIRRDNSIVVADTMVVSSIFRPGRDPERATRYRRLIAARGIVVSFVTVTELRYGASKLG